MRRIISLIIVSILGWTLFDDVLFAQKGTVEQETETETKVIDLTADIVYPVTLNDTVEVMCLVGNFAAQHNGAIITADSAVRYNDKRLECFGNVLINKNTTYAYADKADYNGEINEVNLYAPIIKVVDGEATLYCYNFRFNTLDNIGIYEGGGVMVNGESIMESVTGYYYSDSKELIGVGDVELRGDEYEMKSDSIIYNTETENAIYFEHTNIWNEKDEYLYADAGNYDKASERYTFTLNGYILTDEQEMWSDSMDYYRASEHVYMRQNIQIDDTTHKSLIFGDYGEYVRNPGDMTLIGNPSIISYDLEQGDSLFMRADTFRIFTLNRFAEADSTSTTTSQPLSSSGGDAVEPDASAMQAAESLQEPEMPSDSISMSGASLNGVGSEDDAQDSAEKEQSPAAEKQQVETPTAESSSKSPRAESGSGSGSERSTRGGSGTSASTTGTPPSAPRVGVGSQATQGREGRGGGEPRGREQQGSSTQSESSQRATGEPSRAEQRPNADSLARTREVDSLSVDSMSLDSLSLDSLALDSLARLAALDSLNFWKRLKIKYQERTKERAAIKAEQYAARKIVLDSIGRERQIKINAKLDAEKIREARQIAERRAKLAEKEARKLRRAVDRGKVDAKDTTELMAALAVDTAAIIKSLAPKGVDTLARDSLARDSLARDSMAVDSVTVDSLYRLTKGYRNVRIYRSDFQAVADSMVTNSIDSILKLFIDPILWHDNNQVTSDVMDIYTANSQILKAIFTGGTPIMASEIEPGFYYNQVAGKVITSLFNEGEIYRNDADGNAQTIYFMQDDDTNEVNGLMVMESGSATFYIEEQTVVGITYRGEPTYTLYPMNMIPVTQELSLKGFKWQIDRRPLSKDDVFDRTIRPTVRQERSELPRPTFPIKDQLDMHRKELVEARQWLERDDVVSPQAEEWMESLGFKTGQPREEK